MMVEQKAPPAWQYYLNPWWRERHVYVTRMSPDDCRRQLTESTTRFLGRRVGRSMFSAADFTLHRVTFYNNSFKVYAYLKLRDSVSGGTVVEVTLSNSLYVRGFMVFWYGFLAFWASLVIFFGSQHPSGDASGIGAPALFVALFAAFPVLLNAFGKVLAGGDQAFLIEFLVEELQLTPASPAVLPIA